MKKVLFVLLALLLLGCSIQTKPKIQITHVLAIDEKGDTLRIPIDLIRPINYRIINYSYGSGYGYDWHRPYYREYDYSYITKKSNNNSNNTQNNKQIPERANNKPIVPAGVTNKSVGKENIN